MRTQNGNVNGSFPRRYVANGSAATLVSNGSRPHRAFVALGSNLGDRLEWIERACRALEAQDDVRILRTSGLWETKAMYYEAQDHFINGACEVRSFACLSSSRKFLVLLCFFLFSRSSVGKSVSLSRQLAASFMCPVSLFHGIASTQWMVIFVSASLTVT